MIATYQRRRRRSLQEIPDGGVCRREDGELAPFDFLGQVVILTKKREMRGETPGVR